MHKKNILQAIIHTLEDELLTAQQALDTATQTATHSETIAKSKYDTFGLEASYLAQGQQQRIGEVHIALQALQAQLHHSEKKCNSIKLGSLFALENEKGELHWFYLAAAAGGLKISQQGITLTVITNQAPIAKNLLGKSEDDDVHFNQQNSFIRHIF